MSAWPATLDAHALGMTRTEARTTADSIRIVYLRDPFDGFVLATTADGVAEQLAINPKMEVVNSR